MRLNAVLIAIAVAIILYWLRTKEYMDPKAQIYKYIRETEEINPWFVISMLDNAGIKYNEKEAISVLTEGVRSYVREYIKSL